MKMQEKIFEKGKLQDFWVIEGDLTDWIVPPKGSPYPSYILLVFDSEVFVRAYQGTDKITKNVLKRLLKKASKAQDLHLPPASPKKIICSPSLSEAVSLLEELLEGMGIPIEIKEIPETRHLFQKILFDIHRAKKISYPCLPYLADFSQNSSRLCPYYPFPFRIQILEVF